jgi:hypothetical protein
MIIAIGEYLLSPVATRSDVVHAVRNLNAWRAWHRRNLGLTRRSDVVVVPFGSNSLAFFDMTGVRPRDMTVRAEGPSPLDFGVLWGSGGT